MSARSLNQRRYLDAIERHDIVFGIGPAGTGKTYLAMAQAVSYLLAKRVTRIILARPAVEAGEKLGFLPGDLQEKVNPYLRPLYDALYDMMDGERAERLIERGTIEIAPLAFMRGRTLNDAFVILDEAQNTTSEQMKMFLTRLGFGSKAVVTGDITQIDLPPGKTSGLVEAIKVVGAGRGHRVRPLRRARRRAAQARAADREGVRGVHGGRGQGRHQPGGRVMTAGRRDAPQRPPRDGHQPHAPADACARPRRLALGGGAGPRARRGVGGVRERCADRALNRAHRGKATPTDVLSFPSDEPRFLGDIVIADGVARRQAVRAGHAFGVEARVLALHGLLHLLGYDHETDQGRMKRLEARLRRDAGLREGLIEREGGREAC